MDKNEQTEEEGSKGGKGEIQGRSNRTADWESLCGLGKKKKPPIEGEKNRWSDGWTGVFTEFGVVVLSVHQ